MNLHSHRPVRRLRLLSLVYTFLLKEKECSTTFYAAPTFVRSRHQLVWANRPKAINPERLTFATPVVQQTP